MPKRMPKRTTAVLGAVMATILGTSAVLAAHTFPDVPTTHTFHDDIAWLSDNGITNGYADGNFGPRGLHDAWPDGCVLPSLLQQVRRRHRRDRPGRSRQACRRHRSCRPRRSCRSADGVTGNGSCRPRRR